MTEQYPLNSGDPNAEYLISSADTNLPYAVILVPGPSGNIIASDGTEWISTPLSTVGLALPIQISEGGTGATTVAGARTNLSAAQSGANSDLTSLDTLNVFAVGSESYSGAGTNNVTGNNAYVQSTGGAGLALPDSNTLNSGNASHRNFLAS